MFLKDIYKYLIYTFLKNIISTSKREEPYYT